MDSRIGLLNVGFGTLWKPPRWKVSGWVSGDALT